MEDEQGLFQSTIGKDQPNLPTQVKGKNTNSIAVEGGTYKIKI